MHVCRLQLYAHIQVDRACDDLQQTDGQQCLQQQLQLQPQQLASEVICPTDVTHPSRILEAKATEHECRTRMLRCSCSGHFLQEYAYPSGKTAMNVAALVVLSCWSLCQLALLAFCWYWRLPRQQKVPIIAELLVFSTPAIGFTMTFMRPDVLEWPGNYTPCVSRSALIGGAFAFGGLLNCRAFFEIPLM